MNYLKNLGLSFLYSLISILVLTFILTIFNYINLIKGGFFTFFLIFNLALSVFLGSFKISKESNNKGWFEGLKFGFLFILVITLFNYFILSLNPNFKYLIFSIIILICSLFGGMVGINFKKEKK